jgi:hypothetical protein
MLCGHGGSHVAAVFLLFCTVVLLKHVMCQFADACAGSRMWKHLFSSGNEKNIVTYDLYYLEL